ncbi:DUF1003 domain-containing protein [Dankookia sp. GCM10030260]|uniref:DUF1003 domain-containing protein n=1 Tax=Dankookia sp. GCM10030260 TaxID=3273390 RepID=UPI00362269D2
MRNIDEVVGLEQEAARQRSFADRAADGIAAFVGTVAFVLLRLLWFACWAVVNTGLVTFVPAFDPYPFQLLCLIVSLEGVLLSTFVLIKQNRMGALADQRSHLDLQVSLLAEQEVTKVIQMLQRISTQLGLEAVVMDEEARELSETTAVRNLAHRLRERLHPDHE